MYSALTSLLGALGLGSGEAPVGEGTPIDWESDVVAGGPLAEVPRAYVEGAFKGAHGGDDFQWDKLEESDRMLGVGVTAVVKVRRAARPEGPCLAGEQRRPRRRPPERPARARGAPWGNRGSAALALAPGGLGGLGGTRARFRHARRTVGRRAGRLPRATQRDGVGLAGGKACHRAHMSLSAVAHAWFARCVATRAGARKTPTLAWRLGGLTRSPFPGPPLALFIPRAAASTRGPGCS